MSTIVGIDVARKKVALRIVRFDPLWGTTEPAAPLRQMFAALGVVDVVQSDKEVIRAWGPDGTWRAIGAAMLRAARRALPAEGRADLRRRLAGLYSSGLLPWVFK